MRLDFGCFDIDLVQNRNGAERRHLLRCRWQRPYISVKWITFVFLHVGTQSKMHAGSGRGHTLPNGSPTLRNRGDGSARGLDMQLRGRFPGGSWPVVAEVTGARVSGGMMWVLQGRVKLAQLVCSFLGLPSPVLPPHLCLCYSLGHEHLSFFQLVNSYSSLKTPSRCSLLSRSSSTFQSCLWSSGHPSASVLFFEVSQTLRHRG